MTVNRAGEGTFLRERAKRERERAMGLKGCGRGEMRNMDLRVKIGSILVLTKKNNFFLKEE